MPVYQIGGTAAASHPNLMLPDGWDTVWKAAKAASGTTPCWVTFLGDSISQGLLTTNAMTKPFPMLIRSALLASYTRYADFFPTCLSVSAQATLPGTPPFVVTTPGGTSISWVTWGLISLPEITNAFSGSNAIVYTTQAACTALDILWHDKATASGATWSYNIDGGATQTITCTGGDTNRRVVVTGLSNATHTVNFTAQSATDGLLIIGVAEYNPGGVGIGFANVSDGGLQLSNFTNATHPADMALNWQGKGASTTGYGFPTQPHLCVIELGINDCSVYTGLDQYRSMLARLVQALRRGTANASILFVIPNNPDGINSDFTSANVFTGAENWPQYIRVIYEVARAFNCAVANIHAKWGELGIAGGYFGANASPHPADVGHADIATLLETVI